MIRQLAQLKVQPNLDAVPLAGAPEIPLCKQKTQVDYVIHVQKSQPVDEDEVYVAG